ncbi:MAG: hypothetical protein MZV49_24420 [Rhodopseudomonas palustris]|nr:hypothetical protein [Rhodopseudomonas palustris]
MWAERADFGEEEARRLRAGVAAGARGLKAWKPLGLTARDPSGRLVAGRRPAAGPALGDGRRARRPGHHPRRRPDRLLRPARRDERALRGARRAPGLALLADPAAGPPGPAGLPAVRRDHRRPGGASWPATRGRRSSGPTSAACPRTWRRVGAMLAAHPNWHVDIAARIAELGRQPYSARDLVAPASRTASSSGPTRRPIPAWWAVYARFLETRDESFPYEPPEPSDGARCPGAAARLAGPLARSTAWASRRRSSGSSTRATPAGSSSATCPATPAAT